MKHRKTVKGFLKLMKFVDSHPTLSLRGIEKLTDEQKLSLGSMTGNIGNELGEYFSDFNI